MNLLLFHSSEKNQPLPTTDRRVRHLREVLRLPVGGVFAAGEIDGELGRGIVLGWAGEGLQWRFEPCEGMSPPLPRLTLAVGLSRPQTMRKILQEATAMGGERFLIFPAQRSEPSYRQSSLWTAGEWQERILAGVEQAFTTRVPELVQLSGLAEAISFLADEGLTGASSVVLDNYEASCALPDWLATRDSGEESARAVLWVGPERGWGRADREQLRESGSPLVHLGPRVLRVETALVAAQGHLLAALGAWGNNTPSVTLPRE
ncbi:MAG: 16S rRNA (uracil(1498)-N(3))-methyltransferase [Opitutales bacterium]|nr:16S rRNA (uracil(1498)-N(3))-methyltransferase [Opitutales bacterium]